MYMYFISFEIASAVMLLEYALLTTFTTSALVIVASGLKLNVPSPFA